VNINEFQVLAHDFHKTLKAMSTSFSKEVVTAVLFEEIKAEQNVNGESLDGLPCYSAYSNDISTAIGITFGCIVTTWSPVCIYDFVWELGNIYQNYLDCLEENYPDSPN
jgi:hypothetical protein